MGKPRRALLAFSHALACTAALGMAAGVGASACGAYASDLDAGRDAGGDASGSDGFPIDVSFPPDGTMSDAGSDSGSDGGQFMPPMCPDANQAPVPTGSGSWMCFTVGDRSGSGGTPLAITSLPGPVVYVDRSVAGPGTGTATDPFRTIDQAIAVHPRTIVIRHGVYTLTAPIPVNGALTLTGDLGTTDSRTVLEAPAGQPAISVTGAAGDATITWLDIHGLATGSTTRGAGIRVTGGASAVVSSVSIDLATRGVDADMGALVQATDVTVTHSSQEGVRIASGARASLRSVRVANGTDVGVRVEGGRADITASMVDHNEGGGVVLVDTPTPATGDPTPLLDRLTLLDNTGFGLALRGATTVARGSLLEAANTHNSTAAMAPTSVGVLVRHGARLTLDERIMTDRERGFGSRLEYNDGIGLAAADTGTHVSVAGAEISWNRSVGLLSQGGASPDLIGYSHLGRNTGAALLLLDVAAVPIRCDAIDGTQAGVIAFGGMMTASVGVGLLLASDTSTGIAEMSGNVFATNANFAAVFVGARVMFGLMNPGLEAGGVLADTIMGFSGNSPAVRTLTGTFPTATSQLAIPDVM